MKLVKATFVSILILAAMMASGSLLAGGGHAQSGGSRHPHFGGFQPAHHGRFGVFVGGPVFWPGYYYPSYYSYPPYYDYPPDYSPVVVTPSLEYVEAGSTQPAPVEPQAYWYYCADTKSYYPYVEQCPAGWQRVAPQPPPG